MSIDEGDVRWLSDVKQRRDRKLMEMCQHQRDLIAHCEAVGVEFGGCGDCGSPWLTCNACGDTDGVPDAAYAFKSSVKYVEDVISNREKTR